jgi:hypothetical protein
VSKLDDILGRLAQYRDETLEKPDYMDPQEARLEIKALFTELVGEEPDATEYDLPNYMERCKYRREMLQKIAEL